jgi:uncharacterized membrane protein YsdA (DUF1294 family)
MIYYFFIFINLLNFIFFGYDKYLAKNNKWRISENSLFMMSFMGGSIGAVLGMLLFRHKISKPVFYVSILIIIALQSVLVYYFGFKGLLDILA